MNKEEYLGHPEVAGFVNWMADQVVSRNFALNFLRSRFVPVQIIENVQGIEGLLHAYCWKSGWKHPVTNKLMASQDWATTQKSTVQLGEGLRQAMAAKDQQATLLWSECVLRWGGVSGALAFLKREAAKGNLVQYFESVTPLLRLDCGVDDAELTATSILKFDAGMTKIHAFIDQTGSPIYDSRVGAAISMFVALYTKNRKLKGDHLRFPAGDARGSQVRNPKQFGLLAAPKFYTNAVSREYWARCQLRLGWILQAVLAQSEILQKYSTQHERMQALQGALFMAGYDLRCFQLNSEIDVKRHTNKGEVRVEPLLPPMSQTQGQDGSEHFGKIVPSGFTMNKVVDLFREYKASLGSGDRPTRREFLRWQVATGVNRSTANSNCFPFMDSEMNIYERDAAELQSFFEGGYEALMQMVPQAIPSRDEREHICLICTYLAGITMQYFTDPAQRVEWLVERGFAGTNNSAGTIMSVGRSFGRYFDLIDTQRLPTDNFLEYFQGEAWLELHP